MALRDEFIEKNANQPPDGLLKHAIGFFSLFVP
jgi:hypothetical protein